MARGRWIAGTLALVGALAGVGLAWWSSSDTPNRCGTRFRRGLEPLALRVPAEGDVVAMGWTQVVADVPWGHTFRPSAAVLCLDGREVPAVIGGGSFNTDRGEAIVRTHLDLTQVDDGAHEVVLLVQDEEGTRYEASGSFQVERPAGRVDVHVVDGDGRPTSARLVVADPEGLVVLGRPAGMAYKGRDKELSASFAIGGQGTLFLEPGRYRVLAVRSLFDDVPFQVVTIPGDTRVELTVPAAVDKGDRLLADLHVHTQASYDAQVPDELRYASLVAAGLDVAVITDHNRITNPKPYLDALELEAPGHGTVGLPGIESDMRGRSAGRPNRDDYGHFNAFPLRDERAAPIPSTHQQPLGRHLDAWRDRQALAPFLGELDQVLLELNHPRGIQFKPDEAPSLSAWPLFNRFDYDPSIPVGQGPNGWMLTPVPGTGTTVLDWDALEIVNRFSVPLWRQVRTDWFALLDQGVRMTGTGNSDSHALQVEVAGMTVNVVDTPPPGPSGHLDVAGFIGALRHGGVTVSTGPLVDLTVGDGRPGDEITGTGLTATVRVQAAGWVPVPEVRLVVDGVVVQREALPRRRGDEALDVTLTWPVPLEADGWVLAEAGIPEAGPAPAPGGRYALVAPGYAPIGFTNPVFVDVDGDGWVPPGLPGAPDEGASRRTRGRR
ncbi:MAG: PHP domain-containing protein [Alphaproteobacteria bacterium]|nr:PHP domain-containing protein [Alphaproteobacteria bacterium]